ncbi:dihydropyrimidinase [Arhodomonas sp. AD133]|uniref:dihydropyrimidinase n=1 Tax=Arhodomonas sp. AD133 TaxID=3415009 RepID=UPI003EB988C4
MSDFDLVIRNGTVVTAADTSVCDVAVRDGRIVALGERLAPGREEIDAAGQYVLPGGVDAHCHLDQPMGPGVRMADDFETGTRSAACGGTTTVIPFAAQQKGHSLRAAVDDYHRRAEGLACIDYAFHMIVSDATSAVLSEELPELIEAGYTSFKIYMTYDDLKLDDRQILETLAVARREGAMTMIHAENADCIAWLTEALEAAGHTAPRYHADSRPPVVEREATHRAISLAELVDTPVLIVHVSGTEAVAQIRWAQGRGLRVYAETCPQYLFLTAEDLDIHGFEGAKCVCSPPPRDEASQATVWDGLENGVFQVFSSDHAPFRYEDAEGKKAAGEDAAFQYIPNGVPGLETRLPLLFSAGVLGGRLDITRFVALTATNPARIYGLYPRKGTIAVGADADLAIWDPDAEWTVTNDALHHDVDYTPYEGMRLRGRPVVTLSRGRTVWRDGAFVGEPGNGRFLRCARPQPARPRGESRGF